MIKKKSDFRCLKLAAGDASADFVIDRGATIYSLKLGKPAQELLYCHDYFWDETIDDLGGGWPFLFPVCARLARNNVYGCYQYQGNYYQLNIHGFSWYLPWQLIEQSKASATFKLSANSYTRKHYPFEFEILLNYQLAETHLICQQIYRNHGNNDMPFYAGFHPYFLIPATVKKDQVKIHFNSQHRLIYNEQLTDICGISEPFTGKHSIAETALNESLSKIDRQSAAVLDFPEYQLALNANLQSPVFSYLQLYHIPEKPFFCMEPWMGFPNALNSVAGSYYLAPGDSLEACLKLDCRTKVKQ